MRAVQSIWTSTRGWDEPAPNDSADLVLAFGATDTVAAESWQQLRHRPTDHQ